MGVSGPITKLQLLATECYQKATIALKLFSKGLSTCCSIFYLFYLFTVLSFIPVAHATKMVVTSAIYSYTTVYWLVSVYLCTN